MSRHDCLGTAMNFIFSRLFSLGWLKIKIYTLIVPKCGGKIEHGKLTDSTTLRRNGNSMLWVPELLRYVCELCLRFVSESQDTPRLVGKFMRRCQGRRRMLYNLASLVFFFHTSPRHKINIPGKKVFPHFKHIPLSLLLPLPPSFDASSSVWMRK